MQAKQNNPKHNGNLLNDQTPSEAVAAGADKQAHEPRTSMQTRWDSVLQLPSFRMVLSSGSQQVIGWNSISFVPLSVIQQTPKLSIQSAKPTDTESAAKYLFEEEFSGRDYATVRNCKSFDRSAKFSNKISKRRRRNDDGQTQRVQNRLRPAVNPNSISKKERRNHNSNLK
jgi:hypothetical protein